MSPKLRVRDVIKYVTSSRNYISRTCYASQRNSTKNFQSRSELSAMRGPLPRNENAPSYVRSVAVKFGKWNLQRSIAYLCVGYVGNSRRA